MNGWFLSSCAEDAVVVVVVGPETLLERYQFLDNDFCYPFCYSFCYFCCVSSQSVHLISATCLKLYNGVFSTNVTRKKKRKKHRQTVGTIVGVPGSFHTGVAMQHICNARTVRIFFSSLLPSLIIVFLPVGLATLQRPNFKVLACA